MDRSPEQVLEAVLQAIDKLPEEKFKAVHDAIKDVNECQQKFEEATKQTVYFNDMYRNNTDDSIEQKLLDDAISMTKKANSLQHVLKNKAEDLHNLLNELL